MYRIKWAICLFLLFFYSNLFSQDPIKNIFSKKTKTYKSITEALANPDSVQILDLTDKDLKKFPNEVLAFKRLEKLYLGQNKIKVLPSEIGSLEKLEILDLYSNKIKALPEEISQLKNLKVLDLGSNKLKKIPEPIYNLPKLRHLFLYSNHINVLPDRITELDSLQTLRLSNNHIAKLPEQMGRLQYLQELHLSNNYLKIMPNSVGELKYLEWLDLNYNFFKKIPPPIYALRHLRTLHLWDRNFSKSSKKTLDEKLPETHIYYYKKYEGRVWGIVAGLQSGLYGMAEIGVVRAFKKDFLTIVQGVSLELEDTGRMSAVKASFWVNALISGGIHAVYYMGTKSQNFGLRPEIGLGFGWISLVYGYNILFQDNTKDINRHQFTMRVVVPLRPLINPFKDF